MRQRTIVCPLIQNDGAYLLCKMADDRGVFPGQWAISGGGVEPGERIEEALRREIREELGEQLLLTEITPWTFSDDIRTKTYADGRKEEIGNDSNLLIVFYVQIMPDDFVMQLHRF